MDYEVIFWLVAVIVAVAFTFWAIHEANKEIYVDWITELKDKY